MSINEPVNQSTNSVNSNAESSSMSIENGGGATAAWVNAYFDNGWSVVHLPPRCKTPPADGTTGRGGVDLAREQMLERVGREPNLNLGLRMPDNVIGIDVDDYDNKTGGTTLEWLVNGAPGDDEADPLGPLPVTWTSTSRDDGVSGIRFYRVPAGRSWPGKAGVDIDIIQRNYRYAVTAPSQYPNSTRRYEWIGPDGQRGVAPPRIDELPELPQKWTTYLLSGKGVSGRAGQRCYASDEELVTTVDGFAKGDPCMCVQAASHDALAAAKRELGGAHQALLAPVHKLVLYGMSGSCVGAGDALMAAYEAYIALDPDVHHRDFWLMVAGSIDMVKEDGDEGWFCVDSIEWRGNPDTDAWDGSTSTVSADSSAEAEDKGEERCRLRTGWDVIKHTDIPWMIDQVIHEQGVGQIAAPEDTGKSIFAVDLSLSIANGLDEWCGWAIIRPGPVVYVAMEGGPVISTYIDAWIKAHSGTDLDNFFLLDEEELSLDSVRSVRRFERDLEMAGVEPVLYIFDTQLDVAGDTDEVGPEIGRLYSRARRWLVAQNAFGLFLHHAPYTEKRGRGHTSIRGKCDMMLYLEKKDSLVEFQKVKGNKKPAPYKFSIVPVIGSKSVTIEYPHNAAAHADTDAAQRGFDQSDKDAATESAILDILTNPTDRMLNGKTQGWSNNELFNALKQLKVRKEDPVDVHTHTTYVQPILDGLSKAGLIVNQADSEKSGKAFQWTLGD